MSLVLLQWMKESEKEFWSQDSHHPPVCIKRGCIRDNELNVGFTSSWGSRNCVRRQMESEKEVASLPHLIQSYCFSVLCHWTARCTCAQWIGSWDLTEFHAVSKVGRSLGFSSKEPLSTEEKNHKLEVSREASTHGDSGRRTWDSVRCT